VIDMDHAYIDEHGLIERYVKRQLAADLEHAFEIHLLDCERCLADVEVASLLASSLQATKDGTPSTDEHPTASRPSVPAARLLTGRPWLTAAALAVVALGPAAMVYWTAGAPQRHAPSPLVRDDVQLLALSPVRSADTVPSYRVRLGEAPFPVVFLLEVEPTDCDDYAATLTDPGGAAVWQGDGLALNAWDAVPLAVDSSLLSPGDYRFEVRSGSACPTPQTALASYGLRVLP
jgi:hypothetical protein